MYKRLELHNHTTESDGNLSIQDLAEFMDQDQVDAFALTDHNTISGHAKMARFLKNESINTLCIYGMEYTTYYGHILCLNLREYVPWDNINLHHPELLFKAVREKGALAGIAHPFSPDTCGFTMSITDFSSIDFIEVMNNPEPLDQVNKKALLWWEDLILQGHKIAFTSGMDLHNKDSMHHQFATFIKASERGDIEVELTEAIKSQQTWISKGPLLEADIRPNEKLIRFSIVPSSKPGYLDHPDRKYHLSLRTKKGIRIIPFNDRTSIMVAYSESPIIPKLYQGEVATQNLVCMAPVIYL